MCRAVTQIGGPLRVVAAKPPSTACLESGPVVTNTAKPSKNVASLMQLSTLTPQVDHKASIIQAAFLVGGALGGAFFGFFGRVGDLLGRRKALVLSILTYACCTGFSAIAQTQWQLMIFRFLAALGIGGEWAVGDSLLVETWPKAWCPWMAVTLQCAVNIGVLLACFAGLFFEGARIGFGVDVRVRMLAW